MSPARWLRRVFLPSRTLAFYVGRMFLLRFLGLLIGLVAVLQLLDLLAQADDVMAADGATWAQIATYIALRVPQLASQFTPFAALLSTLLTLATLSQHSEVIVMKAAGLSPHRILFPVGVACLVVAVLHGIFNETIVVRASAELDWWQDNDYAVDLPENPGPRGRVWLKEGNRLIVTESVSRLSQGVVLDKVSIYERADGITFSAIEEADFAIHQNGVWTLHNVRRFNTQSHHVETRSTELWPIDVAPGRFGILNIRASHTPFPDLAAAILRLKQEGLPTDRLMTSLLQKIAAPLSSILMPILGAVAAFGSTRRGGLVLRVITGMAVGFSFFVADNVMLAMGEFGVAPPLIAAFSPVILFLVLGYMLIFFTEEGSPTIRRPRGTRAPRRS